MGEAQRRDGDASGRLVPAVSAARRLSRRSFVKLAAGAALLCAAPALPGCSGGEGSSAGSAQGSEEGGGAETNSITCFYFDTVIEIEAACSQDVLADVESRLNYFENKFSRTIEGSDISNINEAGGEPVEVCEETADVIKKAIEYSEESDGLFDVTIGAVSSLWDFVEGVKPSDEEIAEAVKHVDYHTISVDGTTVTLADPKAKLDLGGIAKGYVTDDVVQMLLDAGCESACLSLGGNVYVMGPSFDGDEWNVGVQDPNGVYDDSVASLATRDMSVVTSGLYERYFEEDGVMYYHILDPKTGYPVETDLESVSITSESSTAADAYATILFLMGHDAAVDFVESDERFPDGIFIDDDDQITTSEGSGFEVLQGDGQ